MTEIAYKCRKLDREAAFETAIYNVILDGEIKNPITLHYFAHLPSNKIKTAILVNGNAGSETIEFLFKDTDFVVDIEYALSRGFSEDMLMNLCQNGCIEVRKRLADNATLPTKYLRVLADDEDVAVRAYVTMNPNATLPIVNYLKYDLDFWVRKYALERVENFRNSEA